MDYRFTAPQTDPQRRRARRPQRPYWHRWQQLRHTQLVAYRGRRSARGCHKLVGLSRHLRRIGATDCQWYHHQQLHRQHRDQRHRLFLLRRCHKWFGRQSGLCRNWTVAAHRLHRWPSEPHSSHRRNWYDQPLLGPGSLRQYVQDLSLRYLRWNFRAPDRAGRNLLR